MHGKIITNTLTYICPSYTHIQYSDGFENNGNYTEQWIIAAITTIEFNYKTNVGTLKQLHNTLLTEL